LLFIPVIENAFKHGISYRENSFIEITMEVTEPLVHFRTRNSVNQKEMPEPEEHTGIGLENVRKRLGLLFPGRHNLEVEPGPEDFRVEISVDIRALLS
ncbi:MAG: sensor histidine kinase, partial [Bacteroidales bacterium]